MADIENHFRAITGEEVEDILKMAQRDVSVDEARWALHCVVLYANEYGQPRGQELSDQEVRCFYFFAFILTDYGWLYMYQYNLILPLYVGC